VKFVDGHKGRYGVAAICCMLSEHGITIGPVHEYTSTLSPKTSGHLGRLTTSVIKARSREWTFASSIVLQDLHDDGKGTIATRPSLQVPEHHVMIATNDT
jgi:hypothetical protein